jgi:hypothetical protein
MKLPIIDLNENEEVSFHWVSGKWRFIPDPRYMRR